MARRTLPAYQLHKASGQAVVRLAGVDVYLGTHGTAASRQKYARVTGEWLAGSRRPPTRHARTVNDLILAYWTFAKGRYVKRGRPTSEVGCIRSALRPLRELYGREPIGRFGPLALATVRQRFVDRGNCLRTVNKNARRIVRAFRWGVARELVDLAVAQALEMVDPLSQAETIAPVRTPVRPVDVALVNATLPHLGRQVAAMVAIQWLTGARPGEIVILRPIDLDRSRRVWRYVPGSFKTEHHGDRHGRIIEIGPQAQTILRPFLDREPAAYCFSPREAMAEHNAEIRARRKSKRWPSHSAEARRIRRGRCHPVWKAGERYTTASYRQAIRRACQAAGLEVWTPHRMRHSAGTIIRSRFGAEAAQVVLGHATLSATEIYAEPDRGKAVEVAERMG